jgi:hypothetical protein
VCVYVFSLSREFPDMILGDNLLISEVVLSQVVGVVQGGVGRRRRRVILGVSWAVVV